MLVTSRTTIDVDRGEVEWCKGIRPFVVRHKSPLSEFSGIHLAVRSRGRGGWNYVLFLQHMSGREVLVDDSRPFQTMDATGRSLAAAFGLPYTADSPTLFGGVL